MLNDVGLIGFTALDISINTRGMERKAVVIRIFVGKTQNLDLSSPSSSCK